MNKKDQYLMIFPENLKKYKNLKIMSELFVEPIEKEAEPALDKLLIYLNMELQTDEVLDKLAWHWDVDFYEITMPREQKIELIKDSFYLKSTKGTKGVLQRALDIVYTGAIVKEWFEYKDGKPFFFKIVSDKIFTIEEIDKINEFIKIYKNVRSTLEGIESKTSYPGQISLGNGTGVSSTLKAFNENIFNVGLGSYLTSRTRTSQYEGGM